jgi:Ca-activated chloride channel family protein
MRNAPAHVFTKARRAFAFVALLSLLCALLVMAHSSQAQQQDTGRPRRTAPTTTPPQQTPRATPRQTPKTTGVVHPGQIVLPDSPPDMIRPEGAEIDEGSTVVVDTDLVNLNVRVIDRNNRPIGDIRQDEIRVFENGIPQPIFSFTREEVPISYGLAIDNSGSMRSQLDKVIEAGKTIINSNKPGDETFLVRFIDSEKIEQVLDFTAKKEDLIDAIDSLYIEGGQTAVIDAVYVASEHVAQYKKGGDDDRRRRALIVVTDGEDRVSQYKQEQLFERLREEDVQLYVIGFVNELDKDGGFIRKSSREKAVNLINRLAKETGGRAFFPESLADLPKIAEEIVRDMRTQYIVSYSPTNKERDGSYRAIRVAVSDTPGKDKRIALTRSGRVATPQGPAIKPPATRLPATNPTRKTIGAGRTP